MLWKTRIAVQELVDNRLVRFKLLTGRPNGLYLFCLCISLQIRVHQRNHQGLRHTSDYHHATGYIRFSLPDAPDFAPSFRSRLEHTFQPLHSCRHQSFVHKKRRRFLSALGPMAGKAVIFDCGVEG